jgi:hypothetical protein
LTGQFAILDYKSGEDGKSLYLVHHGRQRGKRLANKPSDWLDLQLPLYRHLAARWTKSAPVRLGYILLPRALERVGFELATWNAEELACADKVAAQVATDIAAGKFWPPADDPARSWDAGLDRICQIGVFEPRYEPHEVPAPAGARRDGEPVVRHATGGLP